MQENYTLKYQNNDKKPIKIILLGFCILLDLIVIAGVIACFSIKKYIDLLIYLAVFAVAIAIRIVTLFMTFEVNIEFKDADISIIKKYAMWEKILYKGKIVDLKIEKYNYIKENHVKKYVRLCSKSCENNAYMVELLHRNYLIYLDDYSYSLIEVNGDLS